MNEAQVDPNYILCKKSCFRFITAGMYYRVVKYPWDGDVIVYDNKGNEHTFTLKKFFHTDAIKLLLIQLFNTIENED